MGTDEKPRLEGRLAELVASTRAGLEARGLFDTPEPARTRDDIRSPGDTRIHDEISESHEAGSRTAVTRAVRLPRKRFDTVPPTMVTTKPASHPVRVLKARAPLKQRRTWLESLALAQEQYAGLETEIGRAARRIAVHVRALALYTNPHAQTHATLPVFMPSIAALAHDLEWSESYVFRVLSGKIKGATRVERRTRRGGVWREESRNADLERLMTWRTWWTDWACRNAKPSKRFPDGGRHTVAAGTLFYTRASLNPVGWRSAVPAEWLERSWRDLEADVNLDRTARTVRENSSSVSKSTAEKGNGDLLTLSFHSSLAAPSNLTGVEMDTELTRHAEIYTVLDALQGDVARGCEARGRWVEDLANRVCYLLRDSRSLSYWQRVMWTVLKARVRGVNWALEIVRGALWRVLVGAADNDAVRRPGALAVLELRRNGWLEVEEAVLNVRVGRVARA